jgi:hypothetical protein
MARLQCDACGGVYDDASADGVAYFHVCPPLSALEITAAIKAGDLTVDADKAAVALRQPAQLADEPRAAFIDRIIQAAADRGALRRPGYRDENPPAPAKPARDRAARVGRVGATAVPDVTVADAFGRP